MKKEKLYQISTYIYVFTALSIIVTLFLAAGYAHKARNHLLRISDGAITTLPEIIDDLKKGKLVFVGELHDNESHHEIQLMIIRALRESGLPLAIGLEMFQAADQPVLDSWVSGKLGLTEFMQSYYANWQFPWTLYRDIFLYAREQKIPLIGLNVPPEIVQQVSEKGFSSLSKEQLRKLPGASCNIDPTYERFIRRAMGIHSSGKSFKHFCEAQMVWDTTMAYNLVEFIGANPKYTVVVLAGGGHAWKFGIPEQVKRQSDIAFRVILPVVPNRIDRGNATLQETDYLWLDL